MDKIGIDGVSEELVKMGFTQEQGDRREGNLSVELWKEDKQINKMYRIFDGDKFYGKWKTMESDRGSPGSDFVCLFFVFLFLTAP